jgi:predicted transcriptional regulator
MTIETVLQKEFMIAYAKLIIGAHKHRVRPDQTSVARYFNHTAGRFVFARMMILSYFEVNPHKYTITRVADTLDMSRQATSYMIKECLEAEYIHKCPRRGYFASAELFEACLQFMPMHEAIVKETGIHDVMHALSTARKITS